jgi:hypothetical protein
MREERQSSGEMPTFPFVSPIYKNYITSPKTIQNQKKPGRTPMKSPLLLLLIPLGIGCYNGDAEAASKETICVSALGTSVTKNVLVPSNATCGLNGTTVTGDITVMRGAILKARRVQINGDIEANGAVKVDITDSVIRGDIELREGRGARIMNNEIKGDIELERNRGLLMVAGNQVKGDITVEENLGGLHISRNSVDDLECFNNRPAPNGYGNTIKGSRKEQCRNF